MDNKEWLRIVGIGLGTGLLLSVLYKLIEKTTGNKVYTLLLNVDYIPVFKEFEFPESAEVSFHLVVSIGLCFVLFFVIRKLRVTRIILFCSAINVGIGMLLYPTTAFSERTPPIDSIPSVSYWLIGHLIYGVLVGIALRASVKGNFNSKVR